MIYELDEHDFSLVYSLFHGHKQHIPVFSIIEGNFPGRVFVDNIERPKTALVWAIGRWAYIGGDPDCTRFTEKLYELLIKKIIPDTQSIGVNWLEIYSINSPTWIDVIKTNLDELIHSMHYESVYLWDKSKYRQFRNNYEFPTGVEIVKVDTDIIPETTRGADFVKKEFKVKTSVGYNLVSNGTHMAQCRSDGFESGNRFMVEVNTYDKNQRGRGYATAASVGLMDYCIENDLEPQWETTEDNIASQKLALKLGFIENETYPVFVITF